MVRVYGLSILYNGADSTIVLQAAYNLQNFSSFKTESVQEYMEFISKSIVERSEVAFRQSVKEGENVYHVYVRSDNLAGVLISDHEYPYRAAHVLITKILDEYSEKVPASNWPTSRNTVFNNALDGRETNVDFSVLSEYLAKFQDPREADTLTKIHDDLNKHDITLHSGFEAVLERDERLNDLIEKADGASVPNKVFFKTSRETKSNNFLKAHVEIDAPADATSSS